MAQIFDHACKIANWFPFGPLGLCELFVSLIYSAPLNFELQTLLGKNKDKLFIFFIS